jgi:hypothetical protein
MNACTFRGLAILTAVFSSAILPPNSTRPVFGDESVAAHIDSRLNQDNLDKILDHRGTLTEAEIVEMLGPPTSIEVGSIEVGGGDVATPYLKMAWEDVSRIELTCRDGKVVALKGTFSPRLVSQAINYPTFKKINLGSSVNSVCREIFLGHHYRIVENPDRETTTRVLETSVEFYVYFRDGKVTAATRVEHLNR